MIEYTMEQFERTTKRPMIDHFAGLAMQSLISTKNLSGNWDNEELAAIAIFSYAMAVKMIEHKEYLIEGDAI